MRIMWHLDRHGGATVQEVCDALCVSHQAVSRHLRMLYGAGLLSRERDGTSARYALVDWSALWVIEKMIASVEATQEDEQARFADV